MIKFFKDAISEIHNVTWPTKKHYMHISMVAIAFTLSTAVFIWFVDFWFDKVVKSTASTTEQFQASDIEVKTENWENTDLEITTDTSE